MKKRRKSHVVATITILYVIFYSAFIGYRMFYSDRVDLRLKSASIYISVGSTVNDVADALVSAGAVSNRQKFFNHAKMNRFATVKGGHYVVEKNMSYRDLIRMLAVGRQVPVKLVVSGNVRTKEKLAGIVSKQIEADSATVLALLNDSTFLKELNFTPRNSMLLFMPNTYSVYWNRDARQLFRDMKKEFDRFWTADRLAKLKTLNLSKHEAMTLASIAIEESAKNDELPRIAGVYVNRLQKGMLLQADPTVKYAVGDFSLKRVLIVHTEYDSPYNTYRVKGLPPGPICIPPASAVDAVLNYERHEYLYFCAKDDFSGYHVFAKTLQQHNQNANVYRGALNKRKIF